MAQEWTNIFTAAGANMVNFLADLLPVAAALFALPLIVIVVDLAIAMFHRKD